MRYCHIQLAMMLFVIGVQIEKAPAGMILQDQHTVTSQILHSSPVGQTFTAEDPTIQSFAFFLSDQNAQYANGLTVVKLYEGVGTLGNLLDTASRLIPPGTQGYVDFDFSSVSLSVGNVYTAIIERSNARWGIQRNQHTSIEGTPFPNRIDYPGGDYIFSGAIQTIHDARFRVIPVPEPSTFSLFVIGLYRVLRRHDRVR